jgi:hypothetical protein
VRLGLPPRRLCISLVALALGGPAAADLPYRLRQEEVVEVHVDLLEVRGDRSRALGSERIEVSAAAAGTLEVDLPWRDDHGRSAHLRLDAMAPTGSAGGLEELLVQSTVRVGDQRVRSSRRMEVREGHSLLMDAFDRDGRRLVLALTARPSTRPVLVPRTLTSVGARVRFHLEVERVEPERTVDLETNDLNTFVGQDVEYAFHRGEPPEAESVRLRLLPVRIQGDVAQIEVEVSGSLPGGPQPLLLGRREELLLSRGASSSLTVVAGDPPEGYRFVITAGF